MLTDARDTEAGQATALRDAAPTPAPGTPHRALPDVSIVERPAQRGRLDWVGMDGIDLPLTIREAGRLQSVAARADVAVDLPAEDVKGIHMSRLYRLLDGLAGDTPVAPAAIHDLLAAMVESHRDCASTRARLALSFPLMMNRPALATPGLSGWISYPVRIEAEQVDGVSRLEAVVTVAYSSTCPCSAALARQLVEEAFLEAFDGQPSLTPAQAAAWIRQNGTLATPHSQRSEAEVRVTLDPQAPDLGLARLIDAIEQAVGTPVQTAVKREDEQAFALRNGQNLMFVEDAARRIHQALRDDFDTPRIAVRHLESLHPHDAVASTGGR